MFRPTLAAAAVAILAAGPAGAAMLSVQTVSFAVDEPQPAWPGGPGVLVDETVTLTAPIDAAHRLDFIVGGVVPNPLREQQEAAALAAYRAAVVAYDAIRARRANVQRFLDFTYPGLLAAYATQVAAWEACRLLPFADCGPRPAPPARPVMPALPPAPVLTEVTAPATLDLRQGPAADFTIRGEAELEFRLAASLGTVDPAFSYRVAIDGPAEATPGEFFTLGFDVDLASGSINGTTPTFRAALDQILTIDEGWVALTACVTPAGCHTTDRLDFDSDGLPIRTNVWTATPSGITFFSQTLPEAMLSAGIPLLVLEVEANVNLDADDPMNPFGISVNGVSIPPELTIGVSADLATARIEAPVASVRGAVDGDTLSGSGRGDFISMHLDVDATAGLLGGGSLGNDLISVGFDLWDLEAGPFVDLYQDFRLWPELAVTLLFDRPVEIEGLGMRTQWSGDPARVPRIAVTADTVVTPVFRVAADLRSQMGFQLGADFTADLITAGYSLGPLDVEFGPVKSLLFELTNEEARVELFDRRFPLTGFSEVVGQALTIRVQGP